jgi:hypothetical protein
LGNAAGSLHAALKLNASEVTMKLFVIEIRWLSYQINIIQK